MQRNNSKQGSCKASGGGSQERRHVQKVTVKTHDTIAETRSETQIEVGSNRDEKNREIACARKATRESERKTGLELNRRGGESRKRAVSVKIRDAKKEKQVGEEGEEKTR